MAKAANRAANGIVRASGWALALLVGASSASAEPPQKPQIDAFVAHSGLPRSWVVAVKPEIVVAIRDRDSERPGEGPQKIRLQGEAADDAMADQLGYRSMRSVVEINCDTRRDRVAEIEVFQQHALKGQGQKRPVPGGWIQPSEDAYLADVIRAVCRPARSTQAAAAVAEAPALRPALSAGQKTPPRPAPVALARAAPSPPGRGQFGLDTPPARLMTLVATQPARALTPPVSVGRTQAQVGALNSEAEARQVLGRLSPGLPGGLSTRVDVAVVGGRTYYRAIIAGFATPAEAEAYCTDRRRSAAPCLVR